MAKQKKIGIDARFVGPQGTGLGKYTEKLIENLSKLDDTDQYVIFLSPQGASINYGWESKRNFQIKVCDIPWYSVDEQRQLPKIFQKENLDLLHVPHFNVPIFFRGKLVITIHDLIHHSFSETSATTKNPLLFKLKRLAYKKVISSAVKRSQKIIVPSSYVKEQVVGEFKINSSKVIVIYEAAEEEYFEISKFQVSSLLKKYRIKQPFIVYVGNAYPHKNLDCLLEAFAILCKHSLSPLDHSRSGQGEILSEHSGSEKMLNLVIVCSRDIFAQRLQEKINRFNLSDRVTLTGYVEPTDLAVIFKNAQVYVFPTLSEGFGIPGLNAMASKLPVICSNIPTLKEVYGQAAAYFNPNDVNDIAEKITKVLSDDKTRAGLVKKGNIQVKKYSWQRMAQETLGIYQSV